MEDSSDKRVYSGYYTKCDGSQIFVVMVVTDVDTGEEAVIFQEYIYARNPSSSISQPDRAAKVSVRASSRMK